MSLPLLMMRLDPIWIRTRRILCRRPLVSQLVVIAAFTIAIHWTLLTQFNGYIAWGNFIVPFTTSQYPNGPALSWNPYQYGGLPVSLPFAILTNYVEGLGPLTLFSALFGPTGGVKLYIILSTFFVGLSALLFARTVIRHPVGQAIAAVFLIAGPFQIALYGQGDYQPFVAEGFVFLSLFTFWLAVRRPSQRWIWLPVSAWLMILTFQVPQAFLLGFVLLGCKLPVYVRDWRKSVDDTAHQCAIFPSVSVGLPHTRWNWAVRLRGALRPGGIRRTFLADLVALLARLPALIAVAAIVIIPAYVTFYVLGYGATAASSPLAVPLSTFRAYSSSPISLLSLSAYFDLPSKMVGAGAGGAWALGLWTVAVLALLILVWVGYVLTRDLRLPYFLGIVVAAALLGAGPAGPLSRLSIFLYYHFPGYASLNASYYWDWFVIAPLYALMLGLLLEGILMPRTNRSLPAIPPSDRGLKSRFRRGFHRLGNASRNPWWGPATKGLAVALIALLTVAALLPIANGAYYVPGNGIHEVTYPSEYDQIPDLLEKLIGSSYAGVALFNPDVDWFLSNSSNAVPNAFFLYPTVRTAGIPVYLAPPLQSNSYYYWLYEEFYSNTTRYAGELFAAVGVEYLVVFYGSQSASFYPNFLQFTYGKNASELMPFQEGIVPVVQARDFAIYRNLDFNGVALADSTLSLVAGPGYDELNALAYAGVNLANQSLVFPGDLPGNDCDAELNRVARVYAASVNALTWVALQCDHVSVSSPLPETNPSASISQAWVPSTSTLGVPVLDSWPEPLAVTFGVTSQIHIPLSANNCVGSCQVWLPVRFGGDGGVLTFGWAGSSVSLNTSLGYDGLNNTMAWVSLPFGVSGGGSLSVSSSGGWNAIGSVYVFAGGLGAEYASPSDWLNRTLGQSMVISVVPASLVNIRPTTTSGGRLGYIDFLPAETVNSIPGDQGIVVSQVGTSPVGLPIPLIKPAAPGWIAFLVRATGYGYLRVTKGNGSTLQQVGFDSGDYNSTRNNWQTIFVPWNGSQSNLDPAVNLTVLGGTLWLSEIWFVPESVPGSGIPSPVAYPALGSPTLYRINGTSVVNWSSIVSSAGFLTVTANGTFGSAVNLNYFLMGLDFPDFAPPGTSFAMSVNVTPGLWVSVNGAVAGQQGAGGFTLFGPLFQDNSVFPPSSLDIQLESYGDFPEANNRFEFSLKFAFVDQPLQWNVSDFAPVAPISISANSLGYQVNTNGYSLVLVRVGDYQGLVTAGGGTIDPALGTLDTLLWSAPGQSTMTVYPGSIEFLYVGAAVSLIGTAIWIGVELMMQRRRGRGPRKDVQSP